MRFSPFVAVFSVCVLLMMQAGVGRAAEPSGLYKAWIQSSLQRIYLTSEAGTSASYELQAARKQRVSFQIGVQNLTTGAYGAQVRVAEAAGLDVVVRRIGNVPVRFTHGTRKEELEGVGHLPGLGPDPLFPDSEGTAGPFETVGYWVTVSVPEKAEAGPKKLVFTAALGNEAPTTLTATVRVRDFTLANKKGFPVTHWWRPDLLWMHYKLEPFSDEFFAMTEKYLRNMIEHGNNVLFVPSIEGRRETFKYPMQMLLITREGDKWNFDFKHVRRLVNMGKELGFEHFEFPHLWLYWGVKHAIPVYTVEDGEYTRVWSADADGFSPEYLSFLKQYLDALHAFLKEEQILDKSLHHLSDEPDAGGPEAIERYERARKILHEYAPWMDGKVMDALTDINYAKKGITDIPIPLVVTAKGFMDAALPHWVYYCCGPTGDYLNRFMDTPLSKIRMSGVLFYKLKAEGFLHWGYNYWYLFEREEMLDVYQHGDAKAWPGIPYGDPFVVYPGADGPVDSIRWEVFAESLQDYALLQQAGLATDDALLAPVMDYHQFPKSEAWVVRTLDEVMDRAEAKEKERSKQ